MIRATAAKPLPPPPEGARLVHMNGHAWNVQCTGEGSRTVVLVSGLGDLSLVWGNVQPELSRVTRVCSYDRAGLGWSDPSHGPHDPARQADELAAVIKAASITTPVIVAGHSYGGDIARIFAYRHPKDVAALVLIEPSNEDKWERIDKLRPQWAQALAACRTDVANAAAGRPFTPPSVDNYPASSKAMALAWLSTPQAVKANCDEVGSIIGEGPAQVAQASNLGDMPLTVISAGRNIFDNDTALADRVAAGKAWMRMQREDLALSTHSTQVISPTSGHQVPHDDPSLIVKVIGSVLERVR